MPWCTKLVVCIFNSLSQGTRGGLTDTSLLVEIVSCWGLIKADINGSDPYVKVKLGKMDVHTTKHISDT